MVFDGAEARAGADYGVSSGDVEANVRRGFSFHSFFTADVFVSQCQKYVFLPFIPAFDRASDRRSDLAVPWICL